jgi:D-tyrosyl-tRNA(Tyr) deacylase
MRVVLQRVLEASVTIDKTVKAKINSGILILLGIETEDNQNDIDWLVNKIISLRIFNDSEDKMNLSIEDIKGDFIVVSQFTLHASSKKGNRPSYLKAARPEAAIPLYGSFIDSLQKLHQKPVYSGSFGADMKVSLINDGPVTIIIDSKLRE